MRKWSLVILVLGLVVSVVLIGLIPILYHVFAISGFIVFGIALAILLCSVTTFIIKE